MTRRRRVSPSRDSRPRLRLVGVSLTRVALSHLRQARRGALAALLTGALLATAAPAAALASDGAARSDAGTKRVHFRGATVTVPTGWPVKDLSGRAGCVRLDRHAVYLGDPSRSTCRPHLVGHTEAVHLTAGSLTGTTTPDRVVTADDARVSALVTAGNDVALARTIADSVTLDGAGTDVLAPSGARDARTLASTGSTASTSPSTSTSGSSSGSTSQRSTSSSNPSETTYTGLGFDACTAQPLSTMATWFAASPYKSANIYIGGASRGCAQPNLNADWVNQTIAAGWTLIPTYVGLQASCADPDRLPNRIDPAQAAAQGSASADDAIVQLNALGLGGGNPVYFDMEAFNYNNSACLQAAQSFLHAWTVRLHQRGYVSGVYSSVNTMKAMLVDKQGDPSFAQPDAIWFARWPSDRSAPGDPTLQDPAIPDQYWANHQRIHQYRGGHQETWGGITVNIDNDSLDAPVAPWQLAPDGAFVQVAGSSELYVVAGGAPIFVSSPDAAGGAREVRTLSQSQLDSMPDRPRDGTFLQSGATGRIWRVDDGVAHYVPSWTPYGGPQPSIVVDQAALDNAGTGGVWNRLTSGRPSPRMDGTELGTTAHHARFSWFGGYSSSEVIAYDVRWKKARWDGPFGSWQRPDSWQRTAVTDVPLGLKAGYDYCVSVRARNRAGQRSDWTGQRCVARALDDRSLSASAGWTRGSGSRFYHHTVLKTTRKGAALTRSGAHVKRIGLVATTCAKCGAVKVLVDGKKVGRVSLVAPSRHRKQVLMLPAFTRETGTITVRVRSSGRKVQIDGLVVSRT